MDTFSLAFGFAVILYMLERATICLKHQQEYYPPWTGVRPWLNAAYIGILWGAVVWSVASYDIFFSALLHGVEPAPAKDGITEAYGFFMAVFLPSVLFLPVFKSIRRLYSWIAADWNAANQKCWRLLILRAFTCTGVMAGTGAAFILALPALLKALF